MALWIGVGLLGGLGAVLRWAVDLAVRARIPAGDLPVGILAVNLSGAAALGLIAGLAVRGDALLLLGTALVGAYTTFSTWVVDAERLGARGRPGAGAANVVVSLAAGLACVWLGRELGGLL